MEKESKKVKILEKKERVVRIEIEGEDHTLLAPLVSKLLENEKVNIATYNIKHTLQSCFVREDEGGRPDRGGEVGCCFTGIRI